MKLRDLICDGRPAFPPVWQDPYTGASPLSDDPTAGILVGADWGQHQLSISLTLFWKGKRLTGRLITDNASLLPRAYELLSGTVPRHVDELLDLELPPPQRPAPAARQPSAEAIVASGTPPGPVSATSRKPLAGLHPDVVLLVRALVAKGLLTEADVEAVRRETAPAGAPAPPPPRLVGTATGPSPGFGVLHTGDDHRNDDTAVEPNFADSRTSRK